MSIKVNVERDNSGYPAETFEASRGWVIDTTDGKEVLIGSYAIMVRVVGCANNTPEQAAELRNVAANAASVSEAMILLSNQGKVKEACK